MPGNAPYIPHVALNSMSRLTTHDIALAERLLANATQFHHHARNITLRRKVEKYYGKHRHDAIIGQVCRRPSENRFQEVTIPPRSSPNTAEFRIEIIAFTAVARTPRKTLLPAVNAMRAGHDITDRASLATIREYGFRQSRRFRRARKREMTTRRASSFGRHHDMPQSRCLLDTKRRARHHANAARRRRSRDARHADAIRQQDIASRRRRAHLRARRAMMTINDVERDYISAAREFRPGFMMALKRRRAHAEVPGEMSL